MERERLRLLTDALVDVETEKQSDVAGRKRNGAYLQNGGRNVDPVNLWGTCFITVCILHSRPHWASEEGLCPSSSH